MTKKSFSGAPDLFGMTTPTKRTDARPEAVDFVARNCRDVHAALGQAP